MRNRLMSLVVLLCAAAFCTSVARAAESPLKAEAMLVWGTNESTSPDPAHKPVSDEVQKKLKDLPLKWTHYYEVKRKVFVVPLSEAKKENLSDKCAVEIKNLGKTRVEVSLFGKGEQVVKRSQDLPKGETLVLGGNAPNSTAWLVFLKRVE